MEVLGLLTLTAVVIGAVVGAIKGRNPLDPPARPNSHPPPTVGGFRPAAPSPPPRPPAPARRPVAGGGAGLRKTTGASEPTVDWITGRRR